MIVRLPQGARRRSTSSLSEWKGTLAAFCLRAHIKYSTVPARTKEQWAKEIAADAEGHEPDAVAQAIREMDIWNPDGLTSPYQTRFKEPLLAALLQPTKPEPVTITGLDPADWEGYEAPGG